MTQRCPRGLTLLEMIAALAIASILAAGAVMTLSVVRRAEAGLRESHLANMRSSNGLRLLGWLVWQADAGVRPLQGNREQVTFGTWCLAPEGWTVPCLARLRVGTDATNNGAVVSVETTQSAVAVLDPTPLGAHFLYLVSSEDAGSWSTRWDLEVTQPLAIGLVAGIDTLVFRFAGGQR